MFYGIIKDFLEESKGFDWPSSKILKILGDCKSVPGGLSLSETNLLFVGRPNQPFLLLLHLVLLLPICFTIVFPYPLWIFGNRHHGPRRPIFFSSAFSSCRMFPAPHYSAAPLRERDHGAQSRMGFGDHFCMRQARADSACPRPRK